MTGVIEPFDGRTTALVAELQADNTHIPAVVIVDQNGQPVAFGAGGGNALTDAQLRATPLQVETPLPATPICGQGVIVATGVAQALPSGTFKNGVVIKAATNNTQVICVGGAGVTNIVNGTGNGYPLAAGETIAFALPNSNTIFVAGTAGDKFFFAGN